jgi:hypothetical protein
MSRAFYGYGVAIILVCAALAVAMAPKHSGLRFEEANLEAAQASHSAQSGNASTPHSGWLLLGLLERDSDRWAVDAPCFTIDGKKAPSDDATPSVQDALALKDGDRIRLKSRQPLVILDFKNAHEKNLDKSPAGVQLDHGRDTVGIMLPETVLKIDHVEITTHANFRHLWAKVSQTESKFDLEPVTPK